MEDARRDEVDYLPENGVYCLRCFRWGCFHNPVGYRKSPPDATLNFHPFANAVSEWDANERDGIDRTKDELIEDAKSIYEEYGKLFNGGYEMKNDDNLLCAILRLILDDGDGSPSEVYVQKEFNCTNIFLGFGKSQVRTNPLCLHHEIEIGSFSGNWRIWVDDQVVLASRDSYVEDEFNRRLLEIEFGVIQKLVMLSPVDVRLIFERGVKLDFVCCTQEDEVFHCFLPGDRVVTLDPIQGWRDENAIRRNNEP